MVSPTAQSLQAEIALFGGCAASRSQPQFRVSRQDRGPSRNGVYNLKPEATPEEASARAPARRGGVADYVQGRVLRREPLVEVHQLILSKALIRLAPHDLEFTEIPISNLPMYSPDYDDDYPPEATALKEAIERADAVLFVTPEYNRSIPGALKNAIDWASRPWGQNSFDHIPAAVIGASSGPIGTAVSQQACAVSSASAMPVR